LQIESEDGQFRYKIGIIDFLTKFSNFKMLENEIKSKVHGVDSLEVSAIDEVRYQSRFIKFMDQNL